MIVIIIRNSAILYEKFINNPACRQVTMLQYYNNIIIMVQCGYNEVIYTYM